MSENLNSTNTTNLAGVDIHDLAEVEDAKLRENTEKSYSQGQMVWRRFRSHTAAMVSAVVLALIILLALTSIGFGPIPGWWDKTYTATGSVINNGAPNISAGHPLGQDNLGRDYFAMVMRGTQQSLVIAFVVGIVSTVIGALVGAVAGYARGWVDALLMRLTDLVIVIPLLALAAVLGKISTVFTSGGVLPLALVLGLVTWTSLARLVRGEVLSLREKEFVAAAVSMGAKPGRIIFRHLLPNSIGVIVVNATFAISAAILLETTLSYLGFGVKAPDTSLGLLISQNEAAFTTRPWLFWAPGLMILAIALCVNFIGDGLRDAFDPRQSGKVKTRKGGIGGRFGAARGISGREEALDAAADRTAAKNTNDHAQRSETEQ